MAMNFAMCSAIAGILLLCPSVVGLLFLFNWVTIQGFHDLLCNLASLAS
jgi:hypothetical protein